MFHLKFTEGETLRKFWGRSCVPLLSGVASPNCHKSTSFANNKNGRNCSLKSGFIVICEAWGCHLNGSIPKSIHELGIALVWTFLDKVTKYDKVTGKMTWNAIIEMAYMCCSYFRSYAVHECTPENRNSKLRANDHVCCGHWISFPLKPQQTNLTALQRLQRLSPCTQFRYRRCTVDAQSCHDASSNVFQTMRYTNLPWFFQMLTLWHCTENRMLVKCWSSGLPFNISKEIEPCEICKNYWKCRHCEDVLHKMSRVFSTLLKNLTQSY